MRSRTSKVTSGSCSQGKQGAGLGGCHGEAGLQLTTGRTAAFPACAAAVHLLHLLHRLLWLNLQHLGLVWDGVLWPRSAAAEILVGDVVGHVIHVYVRGAQAGPTGSG